MLLAGLCGGAGRVVRATRPDPPHNQNNNTLHIFYIWGVLLRAVWPVGSGRATRRRFARKGRIVFLSWARAAAPRRAKQMNQTFKMLLIDYNIIMRRPKAAATAAAATARSISSSQQQMQQQAAAISSHQQQQQQQQ